MAVTIQASNFWEWLLGQKDFERSISKQGYYEIEIEHLKPSFENWRDELEARYKRNSISKQAPSLPSFSADYYSQTPPPLKRNDLYLVRTGSGNCIVFDSKAFPPPFLHLGQYQAEKLVPRFQKGYLNIKSAFSVQWNEQSFLKALHFCGAFGQVVERICKTKEYQAGPSGHSSSSFTFWMKDTKGRLARFVYDGVDDLDECLYPQNSNIVIPIEAKVDDHPDLSWHKIAFPCHRFIRNSESPLRGGWDSLTAKGLDVVPVYCMYNPYMRYASIYVFPKLKTIKHGSRLGLVLNDIRMFKPERVFRVNMDWI